jgi:hypothetical protein
MRPILPFEAGATQLFFAAPRFMRLHLKRSRSIWPSDGSRVAVSWVGNTAFLFAQKATRLRSRKSGDHPMAFDDVKAEIGLLLTRMQNEPQDAHELYLQLMERLNELKAYGLPIPDDLKALEAALSEDFAEEREADGSGAGAP